MMWLATVCVGLAMWLLFTDGSDLLRPATRRWTAAGWGAKPGAPPASSRLAAGLVGGIAVLVTVDGLAGEWTPLFAIVVVVGTFWVLGRFESREVVQRRRAVVMALPDTIDLLAAVLESGAPLSVATARVAEVCDPATKSGLDEVTARMNVGIGEADAWQGLADDPAWGDSARDLARCAQSGTAVVDVLRVHSADARRRRHELLEKRAKTVGVRSVGPLMCCYLPAFILVGVVPILAGVLGGFIGGS